MADKLDQIVAGFRGLLRNIDQTKITTETFKAREQAKAAETQLYKAVGETKAGLKNLAQDVTDVVSQLETSVPKNIEAKVGVAKIQKSASASLSKPVNSSSKSDLETVVGKDLGTTSKQKNVTIVLPHPQAIAKSLKKVTTDNASQIKNLVKQNIDVEDFDTDIIDEVVGSVLPFSTTIESTIKNIEDTITRGQDAVNRQINQGFGSLIENLVEDIFRPARNTIQSVAKLNGVQQSIPDRDIRRIAEAVSVNKNVDAAVGILQKYSDLDESELRSSLESIDNTAKAQLDTPAPVTLNIPVIKTDQFKNVWREAATDINANGVFTPISDSKTFSNEIANLQREVTEVIIYAFDHGSEFSDIFTPIQTWHEYFVEQENVGYQPHVYIPIFGGSIRGRPLELDMSNTIVENGHWQRSIAIHIAADKYPNDAQMRELETILRAIYDVKPGIQVFGAGKIIGGPQPYFDVNKFIKNKFGKQNAAGYNPSTSDPLTREQLINFRKASMETG